MCRMFSGTLEMSSVEVAERVGVSHRQAASLMRSGAITSRQLRSGAWLTSSGAIDRYLATRRRGRGRTLKPGTAWGVLWELSGLRADWLSSSTRARVLDHIASRTPAELVHADSSRTTVHYFARAKEGSGTELIPTGSADAARLRVGMKSKRHLVCAYPLGRTIEEVATAANLVPSYGGVHQLFENTLPIEWDGPRMPKAVVAADLAQSVNESERTKALTALAYLQRAWLKSQ